MAEISEEAARRFAPFQTDHLIVLVGTNPLPNYVAARLLIRQSNTDHKVWLVHSAATEPVARRLHAHLKHAGVQTETRSVHESNPSDIREVIGKIATCANGRVGLHYTGGTKAMAVHAYLALKQWADETFAKPVYSYLDARHVQMVIDAGNPDGTDACIAVDHDLQMAVTDIAALHGIRFKKGSPVVDLEPWIVEVAIALQKDFQAAKDFRGWLSKTKMDVPIPVSQFEEICRPVMAGLKFQAQPDFCLNDWAGATGTNHKELVSWLNGGWLETLVLKAFKEAAGNCNLFDSGMSYKPVSKTYDLNMPGSDKFEFDVAATRGYQLFAVSCTVEKKDSDCKDKLFQAFVRSKQLGGDEAKVALVCYNDRPGKLQSDFESDNYSARGSIQVFGKDDIPYLRECLTHWIQTARD